MKSKLKRDRGNESSTDKPHLFPEAEGSRIETKSATSDDPALRRFIPNRDEDISLAMKRLGIVDGRKQSRAKSEFPIEQVANKIICMDSEIALRLLPDGSIDCVITSPPYWNIVDYGFEGQLGAGSYEEYLDQLLKVWKQCERVLAPNGKLCINTPIMPISKKVISDQHTRHLKNINNDIEATILRHTGLQRFSLFIWQKQTTEKMFGSYPYPPNLYEQNTVEFISVFVKDGKPKQHPAWVKEASKISEKEWMDLTRQVWNLYPEDVKRTGHPAPFPESLPNRLTALYTFAAAAQGDDLFPGDIVLDPFNGAGATSLAAKKLGRRFIGIDLSPHFCVMAQTRLDRTVPDGRIFLHPAHTTTTANRGTNVAKGEKQSLFM